MGVERRACYEDTPDRGNFHDHGHVHIQINQLLSSCKVSCHGNLFVEEIYVLLV